MNAIINSTDYDKNFYKLIAGQKLFKDPISFVGAFAVVMCCYSGITLLVSGQYEISTYLYLVLGLVLIPVLCFVLPYRKNCKAYEEAMKLTKGKPFIINVKFSLDSLNMKNSLSQSELHKYNEVKSISIKGDLITISLNKGNPIYINKKSFLDCTYDDFKLFIKKNSEITINE